MMADREIFNGSDGGIVDTQCREANDSSSTSSTTSTTSTSASQEPPRPQRCISHHPSCSESVNDELMIPVILISGETVNVKRWRRCTTTKNTRHRILYCLSVLMIFIVRLTSAQSFQNSTQSSFDELEPCSMSSTELSAWASMSHEEKATSSSGIVDLAPCLLYHIKPTEGANTISLPIIQVSPAECAEHRDGTRIGVELLNQNGGVTVGLEESASQKKIGLELISVVIGSHIALSLEEYELKHTGWLESLVQQFQAPYIIGTCSFVAGIEPPIANRMESILLAQVGPQAFYEEHNGPTTPNSYLFGVHLNSNDYAVPHVQALSFWSKEEQSRQERERSMQELEEMGSTYNSSMFEGPPSVPVKVVYRSQSRFFKATCESAINKLRQLGFTDLMITEYEPLEDHDQDGEANQLDQDFLEELADSICPPSTNDVQVESTKNPAIFMCGLSEQQVILKRWIDNECRPLSLWTTASNEIWFQDTIAQVHFTSGGAQWHRRVDYRDLFFSSGQELLEASESLLGKSGDYNTVVSYSIPSIISRHLQEFYSQVQNPNPLADLSSSEGKELLRRAMVALRAETLFGPVLFDDFQRNIGRETVGTQWLPVSGAYSLISADGSTSLQSEYQEEPYAPEFQNVLVSPLLQAEATTQIPVPSAASCDEGAYVNVAHWQNQGALLADGCDGCPENTFSPESSFLKQCTTCPERTSTDGLTRQGFCIEKDENLITSGILVFGHVMTGISWCFSLACLVWMTLHRRSTVVRVSQKEFLMIICVGAIVSSSTIVALSLQAGEGEDTSAATAGCKAAPFLYTIGWVLMYSSLSVKTYRLYKMKVQNAAQGTNTSSTISPRHTNPELSMHQLVKIILQALLIDLAIVISFVLINPLVYEREETGRSVDQETGALTISSVGRCRAQDPDGTSVWAFIVPILVFHFFLILVTNVLLTRVKNVPSKYHESKYISFACILMLEFVLVGIPVLVSVRDLPNAMHMVMTICVPIHDISILGIVFLPKIYRNYKLVKQSPQEVNIVDKSDSEFLTTLKHFKFRKITLKKQAMSRWDEAISIIDQFLDEGAPLNKSMSPKQKEQLESIKILLMKQGDAIHDKLLHLPVNLIKKGAGVVKKGLKPVGTLSSAAISNGVVKPVNQMTDTVRFILKEYGGINTAMPTPNLGEGIKLLDAPLVSQQFEEENLDYVLPEFLSLTKEEKMLVFRLLSWSSLKRWEFNVFELLEITGGKNPLLYVGWAILGSPHAQYAMAHECGVSVRMDELRGYNFADEKLRISSEQLCDYLRAIEQDYVAENPYHNQIHAADVLQTMHTLLQMVGYTFKTSKIDQFCILLAAAVHDVNHPGENNAFQSNARTDLALMYNDQSILENRHAAHAFQVMLRDEPAVGFQSPSRRLSYINHGRSTSLNVLYHNSPAQIKMIRGKIIDAVLHTDMSKHFATVNSIKALLMTHGEECEGSLSDSETSWKLLCYMLHVADISNPAKPDPLFKIWTDRCLDEFFAQGDKERKLGLPISPNCDRRTTMKADSQIGFIRYVILPSYEVLASILYPVEDRIVPIIQANARFWEAQQKEVRAEGESTSEQ